MWIALAASSLPVPDSPYSRILPSERAAFLINAEAAFSVSLLPTIPSQEGGGCSACLDSNECRKGFTWPTALSACPLRSWAATSTGSKFVTEDASNSSPASAVVRSFCTIRSCGAMIIHLEGEERSENLFPQITQIFPASHQSDAQRVATNFRLPLV